MTVENAGPAPGRPLMEGGGGMPAPGGAAGFRRVTRDAAWWYWLATSVLLFIVAPLGRPDAVPAVVALTAVQIAHFSWRRGSLVAFPVQVRLAYLTLFLIGVADPLRAVHWLMFAATSLVVATEYCVLARLLALAPWNRTELLTRELLWRVALAPPTASALALTAPARGAVTAVTD